MRVLFLTHSYPRFVGDAAGSFLLHLAAALVDEGVDVRVVAPAAPGYPAHERLTGITVDRFRYAPQAWETLAYTGEMAQEVRRSLTGKIALGGFMAGGVTTAAKVARAFAPDLVHAHWWFPAGVIALSTPSLRRLPLVTTMHGTDVRLARASSLARPVLRQVLQRSRAVTTVSSWLAAEVTAMAPDISPLIAPMPVSTELFAPGGQRAADRLLFVGRLNEQKGIARLLDALAAMRSRMSLDVVGDGPDSEMLRDRAESLGISARITWHGSRPQHELAPFYRSATALVVPSIGEGLGLVTVEAQLTETPVVAFASGGIVDTISNGVSGLLVPPGDVAALAQACDRLHENPGLRESLGRGGRAAALARFAPAAAARTYAAIYRDARVA
ncbi:MAG: glycosyltransferase [Gemmatimonadaceae bacterium]